MTRDRLPPKQRTSAAGSAPRSQVQRLLRSDGRFFGRLLGAQRTTTVLALQRFGGNQAACSTLPTLHCTARANYASTKKIQVSPPVQSGGSDGGWEASGTLVATFTVAPTIHIPALPRVLSSCARAKMKELVDTELKPHEEEHRSRFQSTDPQNAYVGKTTETVTGTGPIARAARQDALTQCQELFQTILADRTARNRSYAIDEIDPFSVTADISDCPECQPSDES